MRRDSALRIRSDAGGDILEHDVKRAEYALAGPERVLQLPILEFQIAVLVPLLEEGPHFGEVARRGVLKREDRLLLVAHRKDRTGARPGAGTCGELLHQPPHAFPFL